MPDLADGPPGWYGKLAMLGDFAQRRLPDDVVRACDQWLATTMHALPQVLGERWPWGYLEAPLLRFACAPGVFDADWWFGVLMPSCDNVGRYFPLWIAQPCAGPPQDAAGLDRLAQWYEALVRAAVHTLEDGASVVQFEAQLADITPWHAAGGKACDPQSLAVALALLSIHARAPRLDGCTFWWPTTRQSGRAVPLRVVRSFPSVEALAQLLLSDG
ncbi:type VI secretion system-associated protein TagF [Pseudorhodoferax sp. Leaf267]|uniref:type VI secretion system-associated protein TagF n=1 Tax=Pseudorhodoferax sp. Leaf267 TaxID=1736316 RepID=UPI0006FB0DB8|nr:type VI secretion system-associated protein TagF [Pseudorhodoferax sp. Leaf267]KQP22408.1 hypothetical protein ASF43_00290 [Pseudorhodoferax sp. Leaf267]